MTEIIRDGSVAGGIPAVPQFRPVAPEVFAERAARLRTLAPGHALEAYLRFAAALSLAQETTLRRMGDVTLPDDQTLQHCREHGLPSLSVDGHRRDPVWRDVLAAIGTSLNPEALPPQARDVLSALSAAPVDALEAAANNLLAGAYAEVDAGRAPFIAAALQVYWVKMALQLGEAAFSRDVRYGLCPVCGSHPVASVVRVGGAAQGLRYLVCSLCASEWHVVRVKCSACASTKGIGYLGIEGANPAIKAECCDECRAYLKIFYLEKDTALDPVADDLASLALDMLVDEQGYNRVGPNLLFAPGASSQ
ncbi:MAG TPA: formate dehydrogenase accessory protein FdhE [Burkholderiales bacterium]|nr:formate dehydrogenase accessory protein FdhE [Burkholderiales bacterium]